MSNSDFISEDDLDTFEGWLRYQAVDIATASPAMIAEMRAAFNDRPVSGPRVGRRKLRNSPADRLYGVALREGAELWLTLWVRRNPKGEFFVFAPSAVPGVNPHTSYHRDGNLHLKSGERKIFQPVKRQPPLAENFRGVVDLGRYAGHMPKSVGAVCDPTEFDGVLEVPEGVLGPRHGGVSVHLFEPGHALPVERWFEIVQREVFRDVTPWVVLTVGRYSNESRDYT